MIIRNFLVITTLVSAVFSSNYYTSNYALRLLFEKEVNFTLKLGALVEEYPTLEQDLPRSKTFLENPLITRESFSPEVINNPLNQYLLMWKFSHEWVYMANDMLKVSTKSDYDDTFDIVALSGEIKSSQVSEDDLAKAELSVLRVQEFYYLDPVDVIQGRVQNYSARSALSEEQTKKIVMKAKEYGDKCRVHQWGRAMEHLGMEVPDDARGVIKKPPTEEYCESISCSAGRGDGHCVTKDHYIASYQEACNNNSFKLKRSKKRNPPCFLNAIHPTQLLQPIKTEWISVNPPVYQFHGVFTHQECDEFWATGAAQQSRSTLVQKKTDGLGTTDDSRVGTNSWMRNADSSVVKMFSDRVSYATGVQTDVEVEDWQVASYGIGGHYWFHHDYLPEDSDFMGHLGNRLATFMAYLSDVPLGGATAFPNLKLSFFPAKGSALFWFNTNLNQADLPQTLHGGCPVLLGAKHIGNKWIRYKGQFLTYPCGKTPKSLPTLPASLCTYS
ncbi:prolyl 4-hydroxylase subunit alpha-2-like [Symsagittifera roscoffensis]|uniref:prolyl 4-hydroxylase subunit alpha-2-like n=1 Tax=Symsagittifera roscoffensis TaxID=84072 RepID=UPI00307BA6A8